MRTKLILLLVAVSLLLVSQAVSAAGETNESVNATFKAIYYSDKTVTVEGTSVENAGKLLTIMIQGPQKQENVSFTKDYEVQVDSKGYFKLVTEPMQVDSVNIYIQVSSRNSYYLGVQDPNKVPEPVDTSKLSPKPEGPAITSLKTGDPALQTTVSPDSIPEIKQKWAQYAPVFNYEKDSLYTDKPILTSPYHAGALKDQVQQDALNATKFVRYLAGLSEDITLNDGLIQAAQHKVVILEKTYNKNDPHYPVKPADMDENFYDIAKIIGYENLHYGYQPAGAVFSFMEDWGDNNKVSLGHRRAILMPDLQSVGFGYTSNFSVMRLQMKKRPFLQTDYTAWPSPGNFPMEMANLDMFSVQLNPEKYGPIDPEQVRIEVVHKGEKKKWLLYQTSLYRSEGGEVYYTGQSHPNGTSPFISFKAKGISLKAGDEVQIKVTGLQDKSGQDTSIEYTTRFFNLNGEQTTPPPSGEQDSGQNSGSGMYKNASKWAIEELNAAEKNGLVAPVLSLDFNRAITREKFSEVVVKFYEVLTGSTLPAVTTNPFTDTNNPEVLKAYQLGIVNGIAARQFAPTQSISREEIAVMLDRALQLAKPELDAAFAGKANVNNAFADAGKISSWAYDAVGKLHTLGAIKGNANGLFAPKSSTTVEEACILVNRLLESVR